MKKDKKLYYQTIDEIQQIWIIRPMKKFNKNCIIRPMSSFNINIIKPLAYFNMVNIQTNDDVQQFFFTLAPRPNNYRSSAQITGEHVKRWKLHRTF